MTEQNYCETCNGRGGTVEHDWQGIDAWALRLSYVVACPDCLESGLCPRCAAGFDIATLYPLDAFSCSFCGWSFEEAPPC